MNFIIFIIIINIIMHMIKDQLSIIYYNFYFIRFQKKNDRFNTTFS